MEFREARNDDASAIAAVHRRAFRGDHGEVVAELVRVLGARAVDASLVAVERDDVVGHVMFTPALLDAPRELVTISVLSPLGVLPAHQRVGVGRALVGAGLHRVDERDVPLVVLEGDPTYYSRLGFERGRDVGLRRPSLRIPEDAFQCVRLASYQPWMTGTVVYSEPFWQLDAVGLRNQPH